jgi:hypothetical protein
MTGSFKRGSATGRHSWRHLPNNAQANAPRIVTQNGGMFKYLIHIMPARSVDIAFIVSSL